MNFHFSLADVTGESELKRSWRLVSRGHHEQKKEDQIGGWRHDPGDRRSECVLNEHQPQFLEAWVRATSKASSLEKDGVAPQ